MFVQLVIAAKTTDPFFIDSLDSFILNSIHEIEAKDGFFAMDYSSKFYYERTDLKNIGNNLKDESCPISDIVIDKQLFHPETNVKLLLSSII